MLCKMTSYKNWYFSTPPICFDRREQFHHHLFQMMKERLQKNENITTFSIEWGKYNEITGDIEIEGAMNRKQMVELFIQELKQSFVILVGY